MEEKKGCIYLVQPKELVGTERYKIGCSEKNNLERCRKGYRKGTRYICIMECENPFLLEKHILSYFHQKFKLVAGNEFFEGTETEILDGFIEKIQEYRKCEQIIPNKNTNSSLIKMTKKALIVAIHVSQKTITSIYLIGKTIVMFIKH